MARIIEARLADEFINAVKLSGAIHSKFSTVINIRFRMPSGGSRLITLITPDTKGLPDSITIPKEYLDKISVLPIESGVECVDLTFHFKNIFEELEGNIHCLRKSELILGSVGTLNFQEFLCCVETLVHREMFLWASERSNEIVTDLQQFVKAWMEHDIREMEAVLLKDIGLGIGLTPTCDDVFLGIIAVFSGARIYAKALTKRGEKDINDWEQLPVIGSLTQFTELLHNRTTDVSLKYLYCAQEERFSDVVINLVKAIFFAEENLETCVKAVSMVGGSSGMDMLFGMAVACQGLKNKI